MPASRRFPIGRRNDTRFGPDGVMHDAGLDVAETRPGIDGVPTFPARRPAR